MLFSKTLLRELTLTTAATLTVLVAIALVTLFVRLLGSAAEGDLANEAVTTFLIFTLMHFLPVLLSVAVFVGVLMSLSRMWRDHEMVIWMNLGQGLLRWIPPVLGLALPIAVLTALLTSLVIPWANSKKDEYRQELQSRNDVAALVPGVFAETRDGTRVFYVEGLNPLTDTIKHVFLQIQDKGKIGIVVASQGRREQKPDGTRYLVLKDGRRYEGVPGQAQYNIASFQRYAMRIDPLPPQPRADSANNAYLGQLMRSDRPDYLGELSWRIGLPLSTVVLALLAIPLSFVNPRARRSYGLLMAGLLFFIYNNLMSVAQVWIEQGRVLPWVGIMLPHLVMLGAAAWLFYYRTRLRSAPRP